MYLVTGITGNVGGAAAQELLDAGQTVRALVRNPQKAAAWKAKGVDLREGELNDADALADALQGVSGAYLMVPPNPTPAPGYPDTKAIVAAYVEALRRMPTPKLVVLSSVGSEQTSGLGLITGTHLLEQALANVPCPTAFIRAGSFLENYTPGLDTAASTGVFYSFYQPLDRTVPMIATADIGAEVAKLLTSDWTGRRVIELGSPLSPIGVAQAMGKVLGRTVEAQVIPRERWGATFESFGMPPGSSWAYEEMIDGVNSGWIHMGVPGTEAVAATTTAEEVFARVNQR